MSFSWQSKQHGRPLATPVLASTQNPCCETSYMKHQGKSFDTNARKKLSKTNDTNHLKNVRLMLALKRAAGTNEIAAIKHTTVKQSE